MPKEVEKVSKKELQRISSKYPQLSPEGYKNLASAVFRFREQTDDLALLQAEFVHRAAHSFIHKDILSFHSEYFPRILVGFLFEGYSVHTRARKKDFVNHINECLEMLMERPEAMSLHALEIISGVWKGGDQMRKIKNGDAVKVCKGPTKVSTYLEGYRSSLIDVEDIKEDQMFFDMTPLKKRPMEPSEPSLSKPLYVSDRHRQMIDANQFRCWTIPVPSKLSGPEILKWVSHGPTDTKALGRLSETINHKDADVPSGCARKLLARLKPVSRNIFREGTVGSGNTYIDSLHARIRKNRERSRCNPIDQKNRLYDQIGPEHIGFFVKCLEDHDGRHALMNDLGHLDIMSIAMDIRNTRIDVMDGDSDECTHSYVLIPYMLKYPDTISTNHPRAEEVYFIHPSNVKTLVDSWTRSEHTRTNTPDLRDIIASIQTKEVDSAKSTKILSNSRSRHETSAMDRKQAPYEISETDEFFYQMLPKNTETVPSSVLQTLIPTHKFSIIFARFTESHPSFENSHAHTSFPQTRPSSFFKLIFDVSIFRDNLRYLNQSHSSTNSSSLTPILTFTGPQLKEMRKSPRAGCIKTFMTSSVASKSSGDNTMIKQTPSSKSTKRKQPPPNTLTSGQSKLSFGSSSSSRSSKRRKETPISKSEPTLSREDVSQLTRKSPRKKSSRSSTVPENTNEQFDRLLSDEDEDMENTTSQSSSMSMSTTSSSCSPGFLSATMPPLPSVVSLNASSTKQDSDDSAPTSSLQRPDFATFLAERGAVASLFWREQEVVPHTKCKWISMFNEVNESNAPLCGINRTHPFVDSCLFVALQTSYSCYEKWLNLSCIELSQVVFGQPKNNPGIDNQFIIQSIFQCIYYLFIQPERGTLVLQHGDVSSLVKSIISDPAIAKQEMDPVLKSKSDRIHPEDEKEIDAFGTKVMGMFEEYLKQQIPTTFEISSIPNPFTKLVEMFRHDMNTVCISPTRGMARTIFLGLIIIVHFFLRRKYHVHQLLSQRYKEWTQVYGDSSVHGTIGTYIGRHIFMLVDLLTPCNYKHKDETKNTPKE